MSKGPVLLTSVFGVTRGQADVVYSTFWPLAASTCPELLKDSRTKQNAIFLSVLNVAEKGRLVAVCASGVLYHSKFHTKIIQNSKSKSFKIQHQND